jgi:4'-phosphopantetheinyl transferase EntD
VERELASRLPGWPDRAFLRGLFGSEVHIDASSLCTGAMGLSSAEQALVAGAVPGRRREFATGRLLARRLLAELGYLDFELLRDSDRVPSWPENVVGSISHKEELCIVAVASARDRAGLGLDVEPDLPVKPGLERLVCRPRERDWVKSAGPSEQGRRCRAVFSAKEAVYKAFFPRLRQAWGFQDVELEIQLDLDSFRAQLPPSADRGQVEGRILRRNGWILSAVEYT